MRSILLVLPYFTQGKGDFPNLFPLWLQSCGWNPTIDFLLVTDTAVDVPVPPNVRVKQSSLEEVRDRAQALVEFPICLDRPYKLCDFKVAYGEIFAEEVAGYDFWGFCDMDLIWGDLRGYLTDALLDGYKRIFANGHLTLMKNEPEINAAYRLLDPKGCQSYREVFSTPASCCFDEWGGGMSDIFQRNNIPMFALRPYADIEIGRYSLRPTREMKPEYREERCRRHRIYEVRDGKVWGYYDENGQLGCQQFLYIHLQKRPMEIADGVDATCFLIAPPNRILPEQAIDQKTLRRLTCYGRLRWNPKGQLYWALRKVWRWLRRRPN